MKSIFRLLMLALLMLTAAHAESALPDGLRIIETEAFCGATCIGEIVLPEGTEEICSRAFADSSLTAINLPLSLKSIADDAFSGCDAVEISVSPDSPAWQWCAERGLTGVEWTRFEQADSDSIVIGWSASENTVLSCNVLMNIGDRWITLASDVSGQGFRIGGAENGKSYTIALEFSASETVIHDGTAFTFHYSLRTEPQTLSIYDCDYSFWIQDGECTLTEAKLWNDSETAELHIPALLGGCPVTRIGSKAFTYMSGLTSIFIPDTVQRIDSTAFYGCQSLTTVSMADSVTTIGDYAFAECPVLTDVELSGSITSIGSCAFMNDAALTHIDLPASLLSLGRKALYGTGIASIVLPDALEIIGAQAWNDDVSEIIVGEQASTFAMSGGVLYENDLTGLVWAPRYSDMTEYTAPESVTYVAAYAFANCESLTTAAFPGGLVFIGENAFANCANLTTVSGLDSLRTIGDSAFHNCTVLTDDAFQSMTCLESVGAYAFCNCAALESMPFPETLTSLGAYAFESCYALTFVRLGTEMSLIGGAAFYECTSLESVRMPTELTDPEGLGNYLFYNCTNLREIAVPNGLTKLKSYTFHGCENLKTLSLPDNLESIGTAACFKCKALTGLIIPDSVTSIGSYAFTYCESLTELELPACSVGNYGFGACKALESVRFAGIGESAVSLGERAFYLCSALKSAYLPANVTDIHASAFERCSKVVLYVEENSAAHTFAVENEFQYEIIQS